MLFARPKQTWWHPCDGHRVATTILKWFENTGRAWLGLISTEAKYPFVPVYPRPQHFRTWRGLQEWDKCAFLKHYKIVAVALWHIWGHCHVQFGSPSEDLSRKKYCWNQLSKRTRAQSLEPFPCKSSAGWEECTWGLFLILLTTFGHILWESAIKRIKY